MTHLAVLVAPLQQRMPALMDRAVRTTQEWMKANGKATGGGAR
jgi:hypothetical protein